MRVLLIEDEEAIAEEVKEERFRVTSPPWHDRAGHDNRSLPKITSLHQEHHLAGK